MNEKLPPSTLPLSLATIVQANMEPTPLPLPPIDTEGTSTYHIAAAQVPMEFGGTLKSSKGSSKNNSNQQSPQKKVRSSSVGATSHILNPNGRYCTCFGGCGYGQRNRIAMPFWPAMLANLGICALLAGYIFIGSFIFLTIENSNELRGVQQNRAAQLPQIIQNQQQQEQHKLQRTSLSSSLTQKQVENSSVPYPQALSTQSGNVRSPTSDEKNNQSRLHRRLHRRRRRSSRHLGESAATSSTTAIPEVSTHINGVHDDNNSVGVGGKTDNDNAATKKQHPAIVVELAAKHSTDNDDDHDDADDDDEHARLQTLPLAAAAAASVDEDYLGDDAGVVANTLEDFERQRTVENIWDITVSLNILYKENWTRLAALEIAKFQDQLVKRLVMDLTLSTANGATQSQAANSDGHGWNGKQQQTGGVGGYGIYERQRFWHEDNTQQQQQNNQRPHQRWNSNQRFGRLKSEEFEWNFATAFLYSTTVITTVGYGTITARTTLGRMATIGYATLGIPLTLIYLSSVGSVLAKILRYCCNTRTTTTGNGQRKGICCICCLRQPTTRQQKQQQQQETIIGSSSIFNRHPQVADRKTELKFKHFQQPQQQQPLPYCYVRPPAGAATALVTAQEMEMQQHSGSIGGNGSGSGDVVGGGGSGGCVVAGGNTFDNLSIATSAAENQSRQQHAAATTTTTAAAAILSWSIAAPAALCLLLLLAYVAFGATVIALLEDWPLIDGIYFCFMSLSTIGFCDLLPGLSGADSSSYGYNSYTRRSSSTTTTNFVVWFCAIYILTGLTLTSMCVNLLHDEIASRMRVVVKFEKVHELQQEQHESIGGYYSARS